MKIVNYAIRRYGFNFYADLNLRFLYCHCQATIKLPICLNQSVEGNTESRQFCCTAFGGWSKPTPSNQKKKAEINRVAVTRVFLPFRAFSCRYYGFRLVSFEYFSLFRLTHTISFVLDFKGYTDEKGQCENLNKCYSSLSFP